MNLEEYIEDKFFYHSISSLSNRKRTLPFTRALNWIRPSVHEDMIIISHSKSVSLKRICNFQRIDYKPLWDPCDKGSSWGLRQFSRGD